MIERQLIMKFNSCKLTTAYRDVVYNGDTYNPGLVRVGELSGSTTAIGATREACFDLYNEPKGQFVQAYLIDRDDQWSPWRLFSTHLLVLSQIINRGFVDGEVRLLPPETGLSKAEKIYWSNEYIKRKYGNDVNWFEQLSEVEDTLVRFEI